MVAKSQTDPTLRGLLSTSAHAAPTVAIDYGRTESDAFRAFRLVHDQYASISLIDPRPSRLRFFLRDFLPISTLFVARANDRVVGTSAMVRWSALGLPCTGVYRTEVERLVQRGRIVAESTKFACFTPPELSSRGAGRMSVVSTSILQALFRWCWDGGISDWLLVVHPRVREFYENGLGFRLIGEERSCSHVQGKPGVLLGLDLMTLRDGSSQPTQLSQSLFLDPLQAGSTQPPSPPDPACHEVALFLLSDEKVWQEAASNEKEVLLQTLPALALVEQTLRGPTLEGDVRGGFDCFYPALDLEGCMPAELIPGPIALRRVLARIETILSLLSAERDVRFQLKVDDRTPDDLVTVPRALGALVAVTLRALVQASSPGSFVEGYVESTVREQGEFSLTMSASAAVPLSDNLLAAINAELAHYSAALTLQRRPRTLTALTGSIDCLLAPHTLPTTLYAARQHTPQRDEIAHHAPNSSSSGTESLRILVIEDNVVQQLLLKRVLRGWGHLVEVASTGARGLELWEEFKPEMILLDIQLPDTEGFTIARTIRTSERNRVGERDHHGYTPIFASTAFVLEEDKQRCLSAGMDGYIPKPTSLSSLAQAISEVLDFLSRSSPLVNEQQDMRLIDARNRFGRVG